MLDNKICQKSIGKETGRQMFLPDAHKIYSVKVNRSMIKTISVSWTEDPQTFADDAGY
jgi:hypothetical protein